MLITLTVEVETPDGGLTVLADVTHQVDKALDYWFSHTDRDMSNMGVTVKEVEREHG